MKITFEGKTILEIIEDMERVHAAFRKLTASAKPAAPVDALPVAVPPGLAPAGPEHRLPVDKPVNKPVEKPTKTRTPKQLENDERLRQAAQAKKAAGQPMAQKKAAPEPMPMPPPPATAESLGLAPDEIVKLRMKVTEELQAAYANGFQKEVFELLSRFGNGAKSFRELPPEAFVPIREAIDHGALT